MIGVLCCGNVVRYFHVVDEPVYRFADGFGDHGNQDGIVYIFSDAHDIAVCQFRRVFGFF